jgi:hypothetical protein
MNKPLSIGIILLATALSFTNCGLKESFGVNSYAETLMALYFNDKDEKVVFIGKNNHYLFNKGTKAFTEVLRASKLLKLQDHHLDFYTELNQNPMDIKSQVTIRFYKDTLTQKQISWITSHKFLELIPKDHSEARGTYSLIVNMEGRRYQTDKNINKKVEKIDPFLQLNILTHEIKNLSQLSKTPMKIEGEYPVKIDVGKSLLIPFKF